MTLLLKSKNVSGASLGNVSGNSGPQDYVGLLDFSRGEYYTKLSGVRTDYDINEAVNVVRSGDPAIYFDRYGVEKVAQPNQPRFFFDKTEQSFGLYVGDSTGNKITDSSDGALVTLTAAGTNTLMTLSWEGSGTASLSHANLTSEPAKPYSDGKKTIQLYERTVSSQFDATLSVTGDVSNLQFEYRVPPSEKLPLNSEVGKDIVSLKQPFLSLVNGTGTVVVRVVHKDNNAAILDSHATVALRNNVGQGGLYAIARPNFSISSTMELKRVEDGGAVNSGSTAISFTTNARKAVVSIVGWNGYGDSVDMAYSGIFDQSNSGLGNLSPFQDVFIGGEPSFSTGFRSPINGIITHCVIYDRQLTHNELAAMSTMWQS